MFFKKIKNMLLISLLTLVIIPTNVYAYSDYIIAGGENIGIQINSSGIVVVGLYKVNETYPGRDAGLRIGDRIISINNYPVRSIDEMIKVVNNARNNIITISYIRDNMTYSTKLSLIKADVGYKTGLYVKDMISGVGTLTYIDPETKIFGALGHEIAEKATGRIFESNDGKIFKSIVTNIEKSINGSPGEKNATFYSNNIYGKINENTNQGIFGNYSVNLPNKRLYKVASNNEVKIGKASILTVIKDETVEEFEIEIIRINNNGKTKNILFNITDTNLISKTGGVVQGMSGSPIIQSNMIVGAVTHVVVEESTKGYGIFITNMLEEGEN